ncbi:MAG: EAL domain-containing protein [Burkholderiales bacterium]|nr:EAL domain-containing protein [Burkholderiales bacterium]
MSVIRLTWACIAACFSLAMLACLLLSIGVARHHVAEEVGRASVAAATALAQPGPDPAARATPATARAMQEQWAALELSDADGRVLMRLANPRPAGEAPAWFARAVPLNVSPGRALLSAPDNAGGAVSVLARTDRAYEFLWTLTWALLLAVALCGALLVATLTSVLRWARRPLEGFQEQIRALGERRFISIAQPGVSEWVDLSRALNVMVARVGLMLDEKDARLAAMKNETAHDPLTGVASRSAFMECLQRELSDPQGQRSGAVVIVRVHDLVGMNQRVGRLRTDDFLRAVTTVLRTRVYPLETQGGLLARLNGADFCILLPGVAEVALNEWLTSVADSMGTLHDERIAESWNVAWIGASTYRPDEALGEVLTRADAMVMAAETRRERYCITTPAEPLHVIAVAQWRVMIETALETGHVQLAFYPVKGAGTGLLHREAMLRLRSPDGDLMPASAFIPPAIRTGRVVDLDLRAIQLALAELARCDGDVAVNVSPHSICRPIFQRRVEQILSGAGADASRLWIEVDEMGLSESLDELLRFSAATRAFGCKVGIEHFGHRFSFLARLGRTGVSFIKLDREFCVGAHAQTGQQAFVRAVVDVASAMCVQVIADGLDDARDLRVLEDLGVGGATGPLVSDTLHGVVESEAESISSVPSSTSKGA